VVPLLDAGTLLGVLDIDSPQPGRFDEADARGLEALAALFVAGSTPPRVR
jgi:GAF domain-containing protein